MPPRFAYWTIILEGKPTAFRAQLQDELLPTFKQLQTKHPDAVMMWFSKGRLWASPEAAQAAARRPRGDERRKPDWRPGGDHRDPRARFDVPRDEKRRRFAERLRRDARDPVPADQQRPRPDGPRPFRKPESKPGDRPQRDWKNSLADRPPRDRDRDERGDRQRAPQRRQWNSGTGRDAGGRDKPESEWRPKPASNRPRPPRTADRRSGRKPGGGHRGGGGQSR